MSFWDKNDGCKGVVSIKSIPYHSHVGIKITCRLSKPKYSCEYPGWSTITKENYARRKYQLTECGYKSFITKPYQEVSDVCLDSKKLISNTLQKLEVMGSDVVTVVFVFFVRCFFILVAFLDSTRLVTHFLFTSWNLQTVEHMIFELHMIFEIPL